MKGKVSEVKNNSESDISQKKDHIEEELSAKKAVLTQEAGKIEPEIKVSKKQQLIQQEVMNCHKE